MYDGGICKKEGGRSAGRTSLSAQDCHLPAPRKVEKCWKEFFCYLFIYLLFSGVLSLLNCLSVVSLSASTCVLAHVLFFGSPEGKGGGCLPRWIEPSEPGVSTFFIALLCVKRVPTK